MVAREEVAPKCPSTTSANGKKDAGIRKQVNNVTEYNMFFHILKHAGVTQ